MGDGDMDTDKRVDSDGFSLGSDSDADDPPVSRGGSGVDAGDFGQRQTGGAAPAFNHVRDPVGIQTGICRFFELKSFRA